MTYTKREDLTARPGETVVQLDDSGALVAVSCEIERASSGATFLARARAIYPGGEPVLDALSRPVETAHSVTVAANRLDPNLSRDCMLAVLGEPVERTPPWSELTLSKVSIRVSLAAAPLVGQVDAGAVL